jgi:hypothetical protein
MAAVMLPALGLGLTMLLAPSSTNGLVTVDDMLPLDRGGRGNNDDPFLAGDEGPDRKTPLDRR